MHELEEMRLQAYKSSMIYKSKVKKYFDVIPTRLIAWANAEAQIMFKAQSMAHMHLKA